MNLDNTDRQLLQNLVDDINKEAGSNLVNLYFKELAGELNACIEIGNKMTAKPEYSLAESFLDGIYSVISK